MSLLGQSDQSQFKAFIAFFAFNFAGFVVEAWPRGSTQVQIKSGASRFEKANLFSRISFNYLQPIITQGYKTPLAAKDITEFNHDLLNNHWQKAIAKAAAKESKPSLFWTVMTVWTSVDSHHVYRIIASTLTYVLPALLNELLSFIGSYSTPNPQPVSFDVILAFGMCFASVLNSFFMAQYFQVSLDVGVEARTALIAMIYRKSLKLSSAAKQKSTAGEIINHMSVDAERWNDAITFFPMFVSIPYELCIALWLLYQHIGWSVFTGLGTILILLPVQGIIGKFFTKAKAKSFKERVAVFRNRELSSLRKIGTIFSFMSIMFQSMLLIVTLVSFSVYATVGGPNFGPGDMSPQKIFVSISLFEILGTTTESIKTMPEDPSVPVIEIKDGVFAWETEGPEVETPKEKKIREKQEAKKQAQLEKEARQAGKSIPEKSVSVEKDYGPTLTNINLAIARGDLIAVVGRVGQGKTSLLNAMIGDMYKRQGSVRVYGRMAYVAQQAWIVNATLRDNILFGNDFDQARYDQVIKASGLLPDIDMLPAGDQTEIGERGINLSGGQKQRVSLARAAYENADVYLLDGPLSAVDAHVDQHLWQQLIGPNGLLKDKTRVLVTHAIHHLEQADQIVVIRDGEISETGKYEALMDAHKAFYQLIKDYSINEGKKHKEKVADGETTDDESDASTQAGVDKETKKEVAVVKKDDKAGLVGEEEMVHGSVSWSVYSIYAKAASYKLSILIIIFFLGCQGLQIGTNVWLKYWTTQNGAEKHSVGEFLGVYAALVIAFLIATVTVTYITMVTAAIRASTLLHESLLSKMLHLPISFFDTTPLGRIVNRFSSDIFSIDELTPWNFISVFVCGASVLGTIVVIGTTTPVFLAVVPPLRALKRIDSVSKSPIYQHFSETLAGVTTIRALAANDRFISENAAKTDIAASAFFMWVSTNRWLQIRLEALGAIVVLSTALFVVLSRDSLDPSSAGLAMSYALSVNQDITWLIRSYCDLNNQLVAVERVNEYANKNPEAPVETDVVLPENWPQNGLIEFRNYSTRYREGLDLVIKNISFTVQSAEKVGIVGRTGAGKSSLTLALLRIIEAANSHWAKASHNGADQDADPTKAEIADLAAVNVEEDSGSIWIDGVDISTVGLQYLRQHLAIIPQDPTLFVGTVRENLDPFGELEDVQLWEALKRAHLKDHITSLAGGLSFKVSQNGDNFSVGQRSLICLARALLRETEILVLGEATAAVDVETDELIQRIIGKEFKDRTILTIAHRIKTVMDSDKILVLEKGRVQEFEAPAMLLKRPDSLFFSLAQ
ncbi:MAG: multi drug resistance-associated protein MRP [Linnemannia gamsii]|nr:MAG: multi drug resistance-associated protein MRP [Linnemannia gamsii]